MHFRKKIHIIVSIKCDSKLLKKKKELNEISLRCIDLESFHIAGWTQPTMETMVIGCPKHFAWIIAAHKFECDMRQLTPFVAAVISNSLLCCLLFVIFVIFLLLFSVGHMNQFLMIAQWRIHSQHKVQNHGDLCKSGICLSFAKRANFCSCNALFDSVW